MALHTDPHIALEVYPVGSIYLTVNHLNPATYWGGEWEAWGQGRVPVGMGSNGTTDYTTVQGTGGLESVTLTAAQSGLVGHTHTQAVHTHTSSAHTHGVPALSGSTASAGSHVHGKASGGTSRPLWGYDQGDSAAGYTTSSSGQWQVGASAMAAAGAHTHSVSTNASTTGSTTPPATGAATPAINAVAAANAAQAHENRQPFITCYMWIRTA